MLSNFSPHAGDFENTLKQYEQISNLQSGQKLTVNLSNQDLEISYGSSRALGGLALQGLSRRVGAWTGYYNADWATVAQRIESLDALASQLDNYYETHPKEISAENLDLLKTKISDSDKIWNKLVEEDECFLDFTFFPSSGHTMFVTAGFDEIHKKKFFELYDPMDNKSVRMSAEEFKTFLEERYEKKNMTNAMYTYKL